MKPLIVATDFSKEAENSLVYACELAKEIKVKVVLFNSFSLPVSASNALLSAAAFQELLDHNRNLLEAKAKSLALTYGIEIVVETGFMDFARELEALIEKHDAGVLIMGMASKSVEQDLFGNSTTSMIMKLKYPVLAIPYSTKYQGIKKILFAYDEVENSGLLENIRQLALALGAEVEIFHVAKMIAQLNSDNNGLETVSAIEEALKDVPHYYKYVESDSVVRVIEEEIVKVQADLLIMVPQKYGFLESLIHRSKTRVMASNNNVPLLSIPLI